MQPDHINEILPAGKAITFDDRDGSEVALDLVTARHFNETSKNRVLYLHDGHWEKEDNVNTTGTSYNGYWVYTIFIYVDAIAREHEDYSDFTELQNAANAFLSELLGLYCDWELEDDMYYESQVGQREMAEAKIEVKKFATRRF